MQLGGGPLDGLVDALQSLGLSDGVQLLRSSELRDDKHNTGEDKTHNSPSLVSLDSRINCSMFVFSVQSDATVDSGFGSQPMEEEEPPVANE